MPLQIFHRIEGFCVFFCQLRSFRSWSHKTHLTLQNVKKLLPFVIAICAVLSALICVIFVLSTKWKHRAVRHIYYATAATFLTTLVLPIVILLSKKIETFNIASRATYMLFVSCANNIIMCVLACSLFFLIVSVALFLVYKQLYKKAVS